MSKEITVVTGFFKIDRGNWKGFERTDNQYFEHFKVWAKLKNKVIVYVETCEMRDKILAYRRELGLEDCTVVNIVSDCISLVPDLYRGIVAATNNPIQQKFRLQERNPEVWNPTYNYIMLIKAWCVCDAINRQQAAGMVAWLDFGYDHGGEPIHANSDFNYKWEYDFPDKINLFTVQELDERPIFEIVLSMDTYTMGGVLVGAASLWAEFWHLLKISMTELNNCGLSDDDQSVILMAYRKKPEIFCLHRSYWSVQLKQFGGNHLMWSEKYLSRQHKSVRIAIRQVSGKFRHRCNCFWYAVRIFRHMCRVKIH